MGESVLGTPLLPDDLWPIFVLKSDIVWEMRPAEKGCGSGVTCWRPLRDWQKAGVWDHLH